METQGPDIRNSENSKNSQQNVIEPEPPKLDPQCIRNEGITVLNDIVSGLFDLQNAVTIFEYVILPILASIELSDDLSCVILHGLNGNPYHTWLSKDKKFYWPV